MDAALASSSWTPPFAPGDPAPWFETATPRSPRFYFSTATGRYVLLAFLPPPGPAREAALLAFQAHRGLFNDTKLAAFLVLRDAPSIAQARDQVPGLRWFLDGDDKVSRLYSAVADDGQAHPYWLLLDPSHRTLGAYGIQDTAALFARIEALPEVADYADVELFAPVLVVPRVFEPELCQQLIGVYEAHGGAPSGVMRDIGGRTVGVLDNFKRRRDVTIEDPDLRKLLLSRLANRLAPQILRVFQFTTTRLERYIVARYDAEDGGYFLPHRDNETFATAHRRFAVSINLNAEDFEGGDLRFPEFGPRTYRPPTGGAVVFSCSLQHEATPVTRGSRFAFLPFLYDEAGQVIREANLARTAQPDNGAAP